MCGLRTQWPVAACACQRKTRSKTAYCRKQETTASNRRSHRTHDTCTHAHTLRYRTRTRTLSYIHAPMLSEPPYCTPIPRAGLPHTPDPTVGELYTHYRKQAQGQYLLSRGLLDTSGELLALGRGVKKRWRLSLLLPLGASRAAVALQERAAALSACWSRAGQGCQCRAFLRACCLAQSLSSSRRQ